ncbi:MAG: 3-hydroxyacyl-CoA dehydrogenase family protein [Deltaproteobacteria bacterium]|nr:MAG: 3-hydroxyacyl-CoA dehydrogenase family protein [Deltaproteobacteria bacterium]
MASKFFNTLWVVGAGTMGAQIALQSAVHGYTVYMIDLDREILEGASERQIEELRARVQRKELSDDDAAKIMDRLRFSTAMRGLPAPDLVIEAAVEDLEVKREIFRRLDERCPAPTILATNSSSIKISAIESATRRPDRVLNLHFYNPVWQRPVVELMRGSATSDETITTVRSFARSIGVTPLVVQKESTGFLFNRVWRAIKRECLHLVDEGVASFEDVDRAWMIAFGLPMGPFGIMDRIGLDVVRDIEMTYYRESGNPSDAPPKLLLDKIERGELGVKTGKGFYTYPHPAYEDPAWLKGK